MDTVLEVCNLTKKFNDTIILDKCSIKLKQGEIYALLGENGAGKTTFLKIVTGLLSQTGGTIKVLNKSIETNRNEIIGCIGSVINVPTFYENLTAKENLDIHLRYMNKPNGLKLITTVLGMVGLEDVGEKKVSTYSLGMKQRLSIARACIHKPKFLVLDEPINGLDPSGIRYMRELILMLNKELNVTILFSSHILSEVEKMADRIGILCDGYIVDEISIKDENGKFENGIEDYFINIMRRRKNV